MIRRVTKWINFLFSSVSVFDFYSSLINTKLETNQVDQLLVLLCQSSQPVLRLGHCAGLPLLLQRKLVHKIYPQKIIRPGQAYGRPIIGLW